MNKLLFFPYTVVWSTFPRKPCAFPREVALRVLQVTRTSQKSNLQPNYTSIGWYH